MKLGILYSGGKDSTYAAYLAKEKGHQISCLISLISENKESYMFHTPSITKVTTQAKAMNTPIIKQPTKGEKELELQDLKKAIQKAKEKYQIEGIVTGAVESIYQASRIQRICNELQIECFNPLWQKNQKELLKEIIEKKFETIIVGVFAYPLDQTWLGKKIDKQLLTKLEELEKKYGFNMAGEGGEYETYVTNSPLFNNKINITSYKDLGEQHSWKREINTQ